MIKYLWIVFLASVSIPTVGAKRYIASAVESQDCYYKLTLVTGEIVYVPQMFTVIEERRDK